jgi:hypothetical protein
VVDEAAIAEFTGLPRTGDCWFKSTVPSNIEFRSYLQPLHKDLTWKKDIPMSYLEPKWQSLLKATLSISSVKVDTRESCSTTSKF